MILLEIKKNQAQTRQTIVNVLASIWVIGYILSSLMVFFVADFNAEQMYWVYTTFYAFSKQLDLMPALDDVPRFYSARWK